MGRIASDLTERYPPDPAATTGSPEVIRTGRSQQLRLQSAMVVPLRARGRTLGAMTFVYAESGRRYGEEDLAFAEVPEIDGYTFMRTIRSLPPEQGGRTPAVALTAYARGEDAQRAFAAGYQVHVAKPVEPGNLATVVADLRGRTAETP
jgi:CheY-like chemotaxis protein